MNLNLTTSVIKSPANEEHFICTQYKAEFEDASKLVVELVSEEYDTPIALYGPGCDKDTLHGEWIAKFYPFGEDDPFVSVSLGYSLAHIKLAEQAEKPKPRVLINILSMEGTTEVGAEQALLSNLFNKLLNATNAPHLAHIVLKERVSMATWMLGKGLKIASGEYKTHNGAGVYSIDRVWKIVDNKISVKQTLVSIDMTGSMRQTHLIKADQHKQHTFDEVVNGDVGQYCLQPQIPQYTYNGKEITNIQIANQIAQFERSGFSEVFIEMFINEAEDILGKLSRSQGMEQPMGSQGGFNQFMQPMGPNGTWGGQLWHPNQPMMQQNGWPTAQQLNTLETQLSYGQAGNGSGFSTDPRTGRQF